MTVELQPIVNPDEKSALCNTVLRALPDWFGIEESIVSYTEEVKDQLVIAAMVNRQAIGFLAFKQHNAYTAEISVMGILPDYHRQGIGSSLIREGIKAARARGLEFLTVKTLDESRENEEYARTRRFYQKAGFRPLEVFPLLWDECNPCLFLAQYIKESEE